jgi:hypothetical protein
MPTTGSVAQCLRNPSALNPHMRAHADALAHKGRYFHWCLEFADVMLGGGFDVILGNPPFLGGLKISGALGDSYRRWLELAYAPFGGTADLCAAFFRRAFELLKPNGRMGLVATNTIGQGDTRESGLAVILRNGGAITFAQRFIKWQGAASECGGEPRRNRQAACPPAEAHPRRRARALHLLPHRRRPRGGAKATEAKRGEGVS